MAETRFDFDEVRRALSREIERSGIAPTALSTRVSKSNKSLVKDILDDGSDIKLSTLCKLAGELDINVARLIPWAKPEQKPASALNADTLEPLLDAMLPLLPPPGQMTDQSRRALAEALAHGLALLGENATSQASSGEIAVAARGAMFRFRELVN